MAKNRLEIYAEIKPHFTHEISGTNYVIKEREKNEFPLYLIRGSQT